MAGSADLQTLAPPLNVIVDRSGNILENFTSLAILDSSSLLNLVKTEEQERFLLALRTQQVAKDLIFNFRLQEQGHAPYILTLTPGRITKSHVHILAHPIPKGANGNEEYNLRDLHSLKGLVAQLQSLEAMKSRKSYEELPKFTQLTRETRNAIATHGIRISPFQPRSVLMTENASFNLTDFLDKFTLRYGAQCIASKRGFLPLITLSNLPVNLSGNLTALSMILDNLLTNAIKYNVDQGTVQVAIRHKEDPENPSDIILEFQVIDSGPGIPEEDSERVFTMGERLGNGGEEVEGQGVGLADAKERATDLGWDLTFQPNEGKSGTTFILRAKFNQAIKASTPLPFYQINPINKNRSQIRIVFIDDETVSQRVVKQVLTNRLGINSDNLLIAENYEAALSFVQDSSIDLIISDCQLWDGRSGEDLLRQRRERESLDELARIPCILFSATELAVEKCHACGGTNAFEKPYTIPMLNNILEEYFFDTE